MSRKSKFFLITLLLGVVVGLILLNVSAFFCDRVSCTYILPNDVKKVTVMTKSGSYALNLNQIKKLLFILNNTIVFTGELPERSLEMSFDKIVIHRFHKQNVEIEPIGYVGDDIVLRAHQFSKFYLKESTRGELEEILRE